MERVFSSGTVEEVTSTDLNIVLLLSSEAYQDVLLKILNESHLSEGIATKDLEQIVGQIAKTNTITFNETELIPEGARHVKSLHIVVECKDVILSRVLIDNGSF